MSNAGASAVGKRFGGYEIRSYLGQRGGTRVYQALQVNLQRTVRLTVLPASEARKPAHLVRFERELEVVSQLRHDNVLGAIEAGEIDGHRYVVTEDVAGRRLKDALEDERVFSIEEALRIIRDVTAGLARFEDEGFVHRHLTPEAIILTEAGVAKLAGLSRAKRRERGSGETWFDTADDDVRYRAPESLRGSGTLDVRADIYGLGCVLYELLAGRAPFRGPAAVVLAAHVEKEPRSIRLRKPDVPESVEHVVMNCLKKSRADRYQHAAELLHDINALLAGSDVAALRSPTATKASGIRLLGRKRR